MNRDDLREAIKNIYVKSLTTGWYGQEVTLKGEVGEEMANEIAEGVADVLDQALSSQATKHERELLEARLQLFKELRGVYHAPSRIPGEKMFSFDRVLDIQIEALEQDLAQLSSKQDEVV